MFCEKCGNKIDDNVMFCPNCGNRVAAAPQQPVAQQPVVEQPEVQQNVNPEPQPLSYSQPVTGLYQQPAVEVPRAVYQTAPAAQDMTQNAAPAQPAKKKKKVGLIIGIVCGTVVLVLALAAVGIFMFVTSRPIYKVNKAIKAENIEDMDLDTVAEYYDKLSDDDAETVRDRLVEALADAQDRYDDGDLKKKKYEKLLDKVGSIIGDDDEDYLDYVNHLQGVLGTWTFTADIGNAILEQQGVEGYDLSLEFEYTLDFEDDGYVYCNAEFLNLDTFYTDFCDVLFRVFEDSIVSEGYSVEEYEELLQEYYGQTLREYFDELIEESLSYEDMIAELVNDEMNETFEYTYEDGELKIDGEKVDVTVEDDRLLINSANAETMESFEAIGIEYPMEFIKED